MFFFCEIEPNTMILPNPTNIYLFIFYFYIGNCYLFEVQART